MSCIRIPEYYLHARVGLVWTVWYRFLLSESGVGVGSPRALAWPEGCLPTRRRELTGCDTCDAVWLWR